VIGHNQVAQVAGLLKPSRELSYRRFGNNRTKRSPSPSRSTCRYRKTARPAAAIPVTDVIFGAYDVAHLGRSCDRLAGNDARCVSSAVAKSLYSIIDFYRMAAPASLARRLLHTRVSGG
jgi:hypothetical protein